MENKPGRRTARAKLLVAALALASVAVGCQDTGGGGEGSAPGKPGASSKKPPSSAPSKKPVKPSPSESKKPEKPGKDAPADALTCDQLRNAPLQGPSLRLPDAPEGAIAFTDGRWEGDGVVIELQPQCGIGDVTGDPAADAVAAIKVTTGGTGRFYGLVTWRNEAGAPVPAAAASLGDRTPVVSIDASSPAARQVTVVHLTRGDAEPAAVVTIRRTAVYRVMEPAMTELRHSDAPYTP
ncbi:hypothetical protein [Streptomyces sp. c-19]|uniref:hypothetical protein n=1 Tax=Streptomyces sp. c-19 TaxID=2789275 RepID=UPI003980EE57